MVREKSGNFALLELWTPCQTVISRSGTRKIYFEITVDRDEFDF